jgi:hypothetical protein
MPDLRQLLDRAAEGPCEPLDTGRLARRVTHARRVRYGAGVTAVGVLLVGLGLAAWPQLGTSRVELAGPGETQPAEVLVRVPAAPAAEPPLYSACARADTDLAAAPRAAEGPHVASRLDPAPDGHVALTITNHTGEELRFGWECAVHRWQGRGWSEEVRGALIVLSAMSLLEPGATETLQIPIGGLEPGHYRVLLRIPADPTAHRMSDQFMIVPAGDDETAVCDSPPYRPAYLPWLAQGETAGDPHATRGGTPDDPHVTLYWVDDPQAFDAEYPAYNGGVVTVSAIFDPEWNPASSPQVDIRGHPGDLIWTGDPGIGPVGVLWREHAGPCGTYSVGFGMTVGVLDYIDLDDEPVDDSGYPDPQPALERELLRVAESLIRDGPGLRLEGCAALAPRQLPSGAEPGAPTTVVGDYGEELVVWGEHEDRVWQVGGRDAVERPDFSPADWDFSDLAEDDAQLVDMDGHQRLVLPVGDPPVSQIQIRFVAGNCPYVMWIGPGLSLEDAVGYARRF